MLALAHTLVVGGLHDRAFLDRYTVGWPVFERYLLGETDGQPKDAAWAAAITGVAGRNHHGAGAPAARPSRTLIVVSHSLQRAEHGEQPVWMGIVLAAVLGQIGLPGGGFGYGSARIAHDGRRYNAVPIADAAAGPQPRRPTSSRSRASPTCCCIPASTYRLQRPARHLSRYPPGLLGRRQSLPPPPGPQPPAAGLRAGRHARGARTRPGPRRRATPISSCPHHDAGARGYRRQRQRSAAGRRCTGSPRPMARRATTTRSSPASPSGSARARPSPKAAAPRNGCEHLYEPHARRPARRRACRRRASTEFWAGDGHRAAASSPTMAAASRAFRADPDGAPLPTPSGKIEIFSETIASFGDADCPGHPAWLERAQDVPAPSTRRCSWSPTSRHAPAQPARFRRPQRRARSIAGARSRACIPTTRRRAASPTATSSASSTQRGACLAGVRVTDGIRRGVIQLPTGAWYDPVDPAEDAPLCVHGNPNVLTRDVGTSRAGAGLHRAADDRRGRAFHRQSAADPGLHPPGAVAAE